MPGPPSTQGCSVLPPPGAGQCDGLDRADVLGDYLSGKKLSSFPNSDTMCAAMMLEGAQKGFVPQGLALAGGGQAWVTGYVPGKECWVMRVDLHSGDVVRRQVGIDAKGVPACSHAGGAMLNQDGLWVADTHRLWLLDPKQIGKSNAVLDHWTLYQGTEKPKKLKGSFLLGGAGRLGIGQFGKKAGKIRMFRYSDLRKKSTHTLIGQGQPGEGEAAPNGSVEARKKAQGAEWGPSGGLYVSGSTSTCGLLQYDGAEGRREYGFGPGVEEFEFAGATRIWAVFEASAEEYHDKSHLVVPMLAEFDATQLFTSGAKAATC